jgi:hypothetical protein
MKLPVPFVQLPLTFDADRLAAEVDSIDAACWRPHTQKYPGNDALPLLSVGGDPLNESVTGRMAPTPHLQQMPYVRQVLASLGTVLGRCRLMRLSGHAEVTPHVDVHYYWRERVRVHVPIVTQSTVRFYCGTDETHMGVGECWIFDNWRLHRVVNDATRSRVHLVADTVGTQTFWDLVHAGKPHDRVDPNWRTRRVEFDPAIDPPLVYEAVNYPKVMSPWEMNSHLAALFADTEPSPKVQRLAQAMNRFTTAWRSLWAAYGDDDDTGLPLYREVLDRALAELKQLGGGIGTRNGADLITTIEAGVLKPAIANVQSTVDPETRDTGRTAPPARPASPARPTSPGRDPQFDRPVFIVCPPRSGSSLLFETLARARHLFTVGGESHHLIEGIEALRPESHGFESNRLDASDATPTNIEAVRARLLEALRDRDGRAATPQDLPLRMLEKTPKNAVRVPFFAKAFPESRFVFLQRDLREVLSSMIEAWESGRFRTYPQLPGWSGLPWSLVLVPGWRELVGKPLHEIVARQWAATTQALLDDFEALPVERRVVTRYDALLDDPAGEVRRLSAILDFDWDGAITGELPLSRHTISRPAKDKWRRHEREIESVMPALQSLVDRAERLAAA